MIASQINERLYRKMKEKTCFSAAIIGYINEYAKTEGMVNRPPISDKMLIRGKELNSDIRVSDCCMVVRVKSYKKVGDEYFIEFEICSTLGEHHEGTTEWHDIPWCAKWQFVTRL